MDEARDSNEDLKILVVISRAPTHAKSRFRDTAIAALRDTPEDFAFGGHCHFHPQGLPGRIEVRYECH